MAALHDIIVPFEQEGTKAVVRAWLKAVGDAVTENEPLVELETDKVTQEVSAAVGGVLREIVIAADGEAVPGAVLGRIALTTEADVGAAMGAEATAVDGPAAIRGRNSDQDTSLPRRRESISVDDLTRIDPRRRGAYDEGGGEPTPASDTSQATALSPAVRRAVQQHKVDPATIAGSGRGGRVTRADVDAVVAARGNQTAMPAPASPPPNGVRQVPHDRMRLAIAANMLGSVTTAPHVTAVFEADFSAIIAHRRKHQATFEAGGVNLTYTAYMIAASVAAMRAVPVVNSRWYDDRLDVFEDVNIGVGTALGDKGLIVPVVSRAQQLSLLGIATRLGELVTRARDGKLSGRDVRGGTFTISNHGVSGSLLATPVIINQPQSAILGVGKLEKRVVVREVDGSDAMLIRPMAYVSLTIDHRAIDGHQTNAWLTKFVTTLESWPL